MSSDSLNTPYPQISIITMTLNSAETLERTILSVFNQNYPRLEYIIIDGGSQDRTVDIIRKYESQLAYWISEKDSGSADAINKGIRRATGDLIGVIGADDFYLEGVFFEMAKAALRYPEAGIFYGDNIYIGPVRPPFRARAKRGLKKSDFYYLHMCALTAFIRRTCYEQHGAWNTNYKVSNDYELMLRMAYAAVKFQHVDIPVICMHWGGISSQRPDLTSAEIRRAMREYNLPAIMRWRFEAIVWYFHIRSSLREWTLTKPIFQLLYTMRNYFFQVAPPTPPTTSATHTSAAQQP